MFSNHDLAVLIAVAEIGSIRGAGKAMRRTQPAVTQAIRRLEDAAGLILLDRSSYRARLTEHGERFLEHARVIVAQNKGLATFARLLSSGVEPRVRIGLDCAIPFSAWTDLLAGIAQAFPHSEIEIEQGEGHILCPRLVAGDFDVAVLFDLLAPKTMVELQSVPFGTTDFSNVVRADRADYLQEGGALLPQVVVVDFIDPRAFGASEGQHHWRVNNHATQVELIRRGFGWGSVPLHLVQHMVDDGTLKQVSYGGMSLLNRQPFSFYRRQNGVDGPVVAHLWEVANQLASELLENVSI